MSGKAKGSGATIFPTGTCFDDALDYISERIRANPRKAMGLLLVHGICLAPEGRRAGEPFAHAWVEDGAKVWQGGLLDGERVFYSLSSLEFSMRLRPQTSTRYTLLQARDENERSGTYGPWVEEYSALCGGGGQVFAPEAP